jgi:hypothetical protein
MTTSRIVAGSARTPANRSGVSGHWVSLSLIAIAFASHGPIQTAAARQV